MVTLRMKPIIPKDINKKALFDELEKEMKAIQKEMTKDFDSTVQTWSNKPKFDKEFESSKSRIRIFTGTSNEIYGYVSGGTRPHRIMPKKGKALRFRGSYRAKTSPGVIGSKAGGASGGEVFSKGVNHPGTKARKFDEAIGKKWDRPFRSRIDKAIDRARKKSGHAI